MKYIKNLFNGRINRKEFILGAVCACVALFIFTFAFVTIAQNFSPMDKYLSLVVTLIYLLGQVYFYLVTTSLAVRRLHDLNRTGIYVLALFIPIVNIILSVWLLVGKGTVENNNYGPVPNGKANIFKLTFGL